MGNGLVVYENRELARADVVQQSSFMRGLAETLWRDLKPIPYKNLVNDILDDIRHMGDMLEGFTDDNDSPWKRNVYYCYPQGGKQVHGGTTLLAEMFIRKLKLAIGMTMEYVVENDDEMYKITAQGFNPTDKILVMPIEFFESAVIPEWSLRKNKSNGNAYSKEQLAENKARGRKIVMNRARSKARRDIAFMLVGRDIPNLIAQIAYASEIKSVSSKKDLEKYRDNCVAAFAGIGISENRIHAHIGVPKAMWTSVHIASLRGLYSRIKDSQDNGDRLEQTLIFDDEQDETPIAEVPATTKKDDAGQPSARTADITNVTIPGQDEKTKRKPPRTKQCRVCKDMFHKDDVVTIDEGLYECAPGKGCHTTQADSQKPAIEDGKFVCENCMLAVDRITYVDGTGNWCDKCIQKL